MSENEYYYDDELFEWTRNDMLEVILPTYDDFLKIKETLTRIGVASKLGKTLYPSCHVLHKKGKYYIMNFKELFCLDGRKTDITWNDIERRNTIATLLQEWGLLKIVDESKCVYKCHISNIKIIPYKEKSQWTIQPKFTVGKKR